MKQTTLFGFVKRIPSSSKSKGKNTQSQENGLKQVKMTQSQKEKIQLENMDQLEVPSGGSGRGSQRNEIGQKQSNHRLNNESKQTADFGAPELVDGDNYDHLKRRPPISDNGEQNQSSRARIDEKIRRGNEEFSESFRKEKSSQKPRRRLKRLRRKRSESEDSDEYIPDPDIDAAIDREDKALETKYSFGAAQEEEYEPPERAPRRTTGTKTSQKVRFLDNFNTNQKTPRRAPTSSKRTPSTSKPASSSVKKSNSRGTTYESAEDMNLLRRRSAANPTENKSYMNDEGEIQFTKFENPLPEWARPGKLKDSQGRLESHPRHDNTTMMIPDKAWSFFTAVNWYYWKLKSTNREKVFLIKVGKFYEMFYLDSIIGNRELDLRMMGNKMRAGFPEKALDKYIKKLVEKGFVVGLVEQVETQKQLDARLKEAKAKNRRLKKHEKCIKRDMVRIYTKGTYQSPLSTAYHPRFILSIVNKKEDDLGFCIADLSLGFFTAGYVSEGGLQRLQSLLIQFPPSEVLYDPETTPPDMLKVVKTSHLAPLMTRLYEGRGPGQKRWSFPYARKVLEELEFVPGDYSDPESGTRNSFSGKKRVPGTTPEDIFWNSLKLFNNDTEKSSIAGMIAYLKKIKVLDSFLQSSIFNHFSRLSKKRLKMQIDAASLINLEILESSGSGLYEKNPLSVFSKLNQCTGNPAKRMLRKWLAMPELDVEKINSRLDALEDFENEKNFCVKYKSLLKGFGDYERSLIRLFSYSVKTFSDKGEVVLFEDVNSRKLVELKKILQSFKKAFQVLQSFGKSRGGDLKSESLRRMLTVKLDGSESENGEKSSSGFDGLLPDIQTVVKEIEDIVDWSNAEKPLPKPGLDDEYDEAKLEELEAIAAIFELKKHYQKVLGTNVEFTHSKHRYELSIKADYVKKEKKALPKEFQYSSKVKGFNRYITPEIIKKVYQLEVAEENVKRKFSKFIQELFKFVAESRETWLGFCAILTEIDLLITLSEISFSAGCLEMCRPVITEREDHEDPYIVLEDSKHFSLGFDDESYVANSVSIGASKPSCLLITGANMGGKSAFMKQIALTVILGQIGCYVPASRAEFTVVDKIFTRIGANDKLQLGKSTFFVELEDMKLMAEKATKDSLCLVDELGRGTNSKEGVAIASAFLEVLSKMRLRCLFTTHFHHIFRFARDDPNIMYYMTRIVLDGKNENIVFLYKFMEGVTKSSFGVQVARLAGLGEEVLESAKESSLEFERGMLGAYRETDQAYLAAIKDLGLEEEVML